MVMQALAQYPETLEDARVWFLDPHAYSEPYRLWPESAREIARTVASEARKYYARPEHAPVHLLNAVRQRTAWMRLLWRLEALHLRAGGQSKVSHPQSIANPEPEPIRTSLRRRRSPSPPLIARDPVGPSEWCDPLVWAPLPAYVPFWEMEPVPLGVFGAGY